VSPTAESAAGSDDGRARLFFALWPDRATRAALARLAREQQHACGGRAVAAGNLHLTLVFLGDVTAQRIGDVCDIAGNIAAPDFGLTLDTVSYWRHNHIVWAGPRVCPEALRALVAGLESALAHSGFKFDRRAYQPHVTLVRHAPHAPAISTTAALQWPVSGFALVQSLRRGERRVYEVLRQWPAAASGALRGCAKPDNMTGE
jgi:RNA 2',3'-cyclic 3'-phosphodiesterase